MIIRSSSIPIVSRTIAVEFDIYKILINNLFTLSNKWNYMYLEALVSMKGSNM